MTVRLVSYALLFLVALFFPFWVFLLLSIIYGFVYEPYELLIIGLIVDAQFGDVGQYESYTYTISIAILSTALFFIKPQLRIYKN